MQMKVGIKAQSPPVRETDDARDAPASLFISFYSPLPSVYQPLRNPSSSYTRFICCIEPVKFLSTGAAR